MLRGGPVAAARHALEPRVECGLEGGVAQAGDRVAQIEDQLQLGGGVTVGLGALRQRGLKRGVAALCIGGGEATAMAIERL
jgi:acetyl-CoA C-acetyltransferase